MISREESENEANTPADNRMRFFRLLESVEPKEYCSEYELASEVRIGGEFGYSNDNLILRFLTLEEDRDGLFKYTLSFSTPAEYRLLRQQVSPNGYCFEGGEFGEILSLISLFLRCRFFPISRIFRGVSGPPLIKDGYDFSYVRPQRNTDKHLFDSSNRNFVDLNNFFEQVKKLPENLHHRFANAVRLYALALREIGVNDQFAYVHLVSAIEVLSTYQELPKNQDPLQTEMDKIRELLSSASTDAKSELGNLFNQRKTMMKFIDFIQKQSEDLIKERPAAGALGNKIYKDNLRDSLERIYKARSKFLHEGSSMYLGIPGATSEGCDYDNSVGQTIDNREFNSEDKLPNIGFFENLVQKCLLKYLITNITS